MGICILVVLSQFFVYGLEDDSIIGIRISGRWYCAIWLLLGYLCLVMTAIRHAREHAR